MVTERARIDSLDAGRALLARAAAGHPLELLVTVSASVPAWLAELVVVASSADAAVVVEAVAPAALGGEALDGWEIGVCTAALTAGASDVLGIAPGRVARVRAIVESLAGPTLARTAVEPAS